uniref:E3 ubiquitin-protein ligase KEG n=1 Tax=Oryzias latipes TaxID=8090 RepID=A0A3P9M1T5_ORYLA
MLSEIECGVCYRSFNAARCCPRELHCKHSFCESCLRRLGRGLAGRTVIDCPLCRHPTVLTGEPGEAAVRAQLRVDECALERLVAAGVLDQDQEEDEEEETEEVKESPVEQRDVSSGVERGMLRRSWKKVWRAISGKRSEQRVDDCMTSDELRNLALMSCYMF